MGDVRYLAEAAARRLREPEVRRHYLSRIEDAVRRDDRALIAELAADYARVLKLISRARRSA
ncbi:MAG: hypothetical protein IRZ02_00730 [Acidothermus sp.]|nr:hypothetical protein [Acidothermus sp.]MCL6537525.1 hypothetical protein [Acidothermus sp.]